jgi:hypothetical protein
MLDVVAVSTKAVAWEGNDGIQRRLHDKDNNGVGSKGVFLSHHHSVMRAVLSTVFILGLAEA